MAQTLTGEERRQPAESTASLTEYVCPMHPEIVRNAPGNCPICGMALEPKAPSAVEQQNPELADMKRRFWISLVLTIPVFIAAMGEMIPGQPLQHLATQRTWTWVELILGSPVILWGGWPPCWSAPLGGGSSPPPRRCYFLPRSFLGPRLSLSSAAL